jgi:class 3 adenylate cyclase/tetratricopeptide (TPR) repeat protein
MKCTKCQFENPEEAKFCIECGAPMDWRCPKCGAQTPTTGKFCMDCGANLSTPSDLLPKDLSFDQKIEKIQKYLPKGLTEKILSQRDKIEGERKHVTVMFCDMQGFTALSERLGPEEAYVIMDDVYEIMIHKVHDYEGTVNEMTGDGIMALFGAPIALEDAPQRAIRSAYAIHREMGKFSEGLKQEKQMTFALKMRIGINTGPVVVGTLGNDLRVEFKAVGDTVNLASRMEGMAEPGTTYVTEETYKLTEGLFSFETLGARKIKGKEEQIKAFRVIGPSTRRTRFDVRADRGLTPFVGRERELELLLDGFELARAGRGQAVSIVAEAGVGKSRLLYEFRKAVYGEDATFLEGRCLSYSRSTAFYPIIDILKANFDIREDDRDMEIKEKVINGLKELFSVKDSGIDKLSLSPEGRKDQIIQAVRRITVMGAEIRPLILAYEDLHWSDKNSEDLLKRILENLPGARILMIFTYRPEFVHTWGAKSYHSQVTLNRLSNRESLAMVSDILGTEKIERNLEELILEKTEGIPFFIEEFIGALKNLNIIERKDHTYYLSKNIQELTIPSTIHDVIMSRVDSLPEGTKEVLQTGSVVGRDFSHRLIKRVTGLGEQELLSYLSVLKDSELLYERGVYPEATYIIKHALTQEVIYDSILTKRKRNLHAKTGDAIEEVYKGNLHEHCGVLAEHYITGENYKKGAEYAKLAGKKSEKTASLNDAIAYARKRIFCLEKLPVTDAVQKKIVDARTTLGLYIIQLNYPIEAKKAVEPIIDTALKIGHKGRLSQIYCIIGTYEFEVEEDFSKALNHFRKALTISEEVKDIPSLFFSYYCLGLAYWLNCEFGNAAYHFGKALEINVATNSPWGISAMKTLLSTNSLARGDIDLAYQTSVEALRMAEESGDTYSKSIAYIAHGFSFMNKGIFTEAEHYLLKGVDLCDRINFFIWNNFAYTSLAERNFQNREYEKSKACYKKAIWYLEQAGFGPSRANFSRVGITRAKVMNNEGDINLIYLYDFPHENKIKQFDGLIRRYMGEILLNIDDQHRSEAKNWIEKAIEADEKNGMRFNLGQDYASYAEWFRRAGELPTAKENLGKAIEILKDCGADGWVDKYEKELELLEI